MPKKKTSKKKKTTAKQFYSKFKKKFDFDKLESSLKKSYHKYHKALKANFKTNFKLKKFKLGKLKVDTSYSYLFPVFVAFLGFLVFLKSTPKTTITLESTKLQKYFEKTKSMDLSDRIDFWSKELYQKPSMLKALGTTPKVNDTVPLFPNAYDCTTYVETVGALSMSKNSSEVAQHLIEIRYKDGDISYVNRNHFPEADWIPNNVSAGLLKDITVSTARDSGFLASFVNKDINKTAWFKSQHNEHYYRSVASTDRGGSDTTVRLPYIPLDRALEVANNIPNGSIINVVRENKASQPVLITHQGFLVWKNGVAYLRHASSNKEITEVPFKHYLRNAKSYPWKVLGININQFRS